MRNDLEGRANAMDQMLAEWQIRNVIARFARAVDRRDEQLLRECYHADAGIHYGAFDGNLSEYVAWVIETVSDASLTVHFQGATIIDWPRETRGSVAITETYAVALNEKQGGDQRDNWISGIRYLDRFEHRTDTSTTGWRIAERTMVGEWLRVDPLSNHRRFSGNVFRGRAGAHDPIFQFLTRNGIGWSSKTDGDC